MYFVVLLCPCICLAHRWRNREVRKGQISGGH